MPPLARAEGAALLDRFRRYLRDHRQPVTRQRDLIAQIVFLSDDHPSVDAIIRRKPLVCLVDELAHTNVPGSRNAKRYQDVLELLEAGITRNSELPEMNRDMQLIIDECRSKLEDGGAAEAEPTSAAQLLLQQFGKGTKH